MSRSKHIVTYSVLIAISCIPIFHNNLNELYAFPSIAEGLHHDECVNIMTYNIAAYDSASFPPERQQRLIKVIEREKPDIVCFQELSFETLKRIKPQLDSIYGPCEVLKGDNQYWRLKFYSHLPMRNFCKYNCEGEFDTSGLTDEETHMIERSQKLMSVMSAEFEVEPGKWVRLYSGQLHSSAYSTARRSMDEDASWLSGLGLYWRNYKVGKRIRDYEAENVRRLIDEARTSKSSSTRMPVIVAGDLNDWNGSYCLKTLCEGSKSSKSFKDELKDAWSEGGRGFGWTYFGWGLRLRLDHILYSDELELVDVKVVDSDLSDHKPLMARFRVK